MAEFNLLDSIPKIVRDVAARRINKEFNRRLALRFGREYFDGPREQGYGGYRYDGRWIPVARRIIDHWKLKPGDRVLDIGCAKGFLMHDLMALMPGLEIWGIDISRYALAHAHELTGRRMVRATCAELPFADDSFALALSINTVHNLPPMGCRQALREMQRVAPDRGFVQVDAYRSAAERQIFEDWMLTAQTYCTPEEWRAMFDDVGYRGDWHWTILEAEPEHQNKPH